MEKFENQTYKSKYYNIDEYYKNVASKEGWKKEDFVWALKILELLPREKLIQICKDPRIELRFTGENWEETTPEEEIVGALISDYPPDILINVLKEE